MRLFVLLLAALPLAAQPSAARNGGEIRGGSRYSPEEGWKPLIDGKDMKGWRTADGKPLEWVAVRDVRWDSQDSPQLLHPAAGAGGIIVNGPKGRTSNLATEQKFGDVELYVEFLISQGSNSGVYLQGLYEVQISDSHGKPRPTSHDCGGIYQRWIDKKGVGGTAPLQNAALPAGQWQSFEIRFRAPRFSGGRKVENARFLRVLHNGVPIQENVEAEGPTRASMNIAEAAANPIMLQGDHGPVAFRNIQIRPLHPRAGK